MADEQEPAGGAAKLPNPWGRPQAGENPYLHNLFVLLGINPDDLEKDINLQVRRLNRALGDGGQTRTVHGRTVEPTDLARFDQVTQNAGEFLIERLLVHTRHKVDESKFERMTKEIDGTRSDEPRELLPLAVRDLRFLTQLLPAPADVAAGDVAAPPAAELTALFRPDPAAERVWDL